MLLQHTLISEKLRSLYSSLLALHESFSSPFKQYSEYLQLSSLIFQLIRSIENSELQNQSRLAQAEALLQESEFITNLKGYLNKTNDNLIRNYKMQLSSIEKEMQGLRTENQIINGTKDALEMKIFNFTQELEKQRRHTRLSLIFADKSEKICARCQRVYKPADNFKWSCQHHRAKIVNGVWFCCGKIGEGAEGCIRTEHISGEELDEVEKNPGKVVFCNVFVKQNCKNKEHNSNECPYDPNVRSGNNPQDELKRLQHNEIRKVQNKSKVSKTELSQLKRTFRAKQINLEDSEISDLDIEDILQF
jgi:hypothetical protein